MAYTLGIDYGTNSVRALLVDVSNGRELATGVLDCPSGKQGILLDPRDANLPGSTLATSQPVTYRPDSENQSVYDQLYVLYRRLHDAFGGLNRCADLSGVMKDLIRIKEAQTAR